MSLLNGKFRLEESVLIQSHRHPDVLPGTTGIIDCFHQSGYGVKVTGEWMIAGSDRGATYRGTEVCWYPGEELEHQKS